MYSSVDKNFPSLIKVHLLVSEKYINIFIQYELDTYSNALLINCFGFNRGILVDF